MKKAISSVILLGLILSLFATALPAFAADTAKSGIYALKVESGYAVTVKDKDNTVLSSSPVDGKDLYADAVKFDVSYSFSDKAVFHLGLMLSGESKIPDKDNIWYIDQTVANSGNVSFTIYPKEMQKDAAYAIYVSKSNGSGLELVASFKYYMPVTLGDVDNNGKVTANDALYALQVAVNVPEIKIGTTVFPVTATVRAAADADCNNKVSANDALIILKLAVNK